MRSSRLLQGVLENSSCSWYSMFLKGSEHVMFECLQEQATSDFVLASPSKA